MFAKNCGQLTLVFRERSFLQAEKKETEQMVFYLRASNDVGTELGTIFIYINPTDFFAWEWQGSGINTGGTFQWSHNGNGYMLELFESGGRFGSLFCPAWNVPPNPNGEPLRPWFSQLGNNVGLGSVSNGPPARLVTAFNWHLR